MKIRKLKSSEIELRVGTARKDGCSLLLYKDARCDMRILDEVFGPMNWQRSHQLIDGNLYCSVSVKDSNGEWVSKQDVGTESFTEKEKGQASDSFKRACFNWGIGRELYTAPFIWIKLNSNEVTEKNGKPQINVKFYVKSIDYSDSGDIKTLVIVDDKGVERFSYGAKKQATQPQAQQSVDYIKLTREYLINNDKAREWYCNKSKVSSIDELDLSKVYEHLKSKNKI